MGIVQRHALARTVRALAQATTSAQFGDPAAQSYAASQGFRVLDGFSVEAAQAREPRIDARQQRGHRQRLPRRTETTATFRTYIDLPGAATPEQDLLLEAALGMANGGRTEFTPADTPTALNLLFESENVIGEGVLGWGCDQLTIALPNAEEPTFEFTGPAKLNVSAAQATGTITGDVITVVPAINAAAFEIGSLVVELDATTGLQALTPNFGRVISRDLSAGTVTLDGGNTIPGTATRFGPYAGGFNEAAANFPANARPAYTAQSFLQIGTGVDTGADFGNPPAFTTFDFESAEITVNNNLLIKNPASVPTLTDFCPDYRDVGGNITFFAGQQELLHKVIAKTFNQQSGFREIVWWLRFRLGGAVSGDPQLLIDMPRVQLDRGALNLAQGALGDFSLPFMAMAPLPLDETDNEIRLAYGVAA